MRTQLGNYVHSNWWRRPWELPYDLYREARDFIHRGLYGFSKSDTWSLNDYLASWIPSALEVYKHDHLVHEGLDFDLMQDGFKAVIELGEGFPKEEELKGLQARADKGLQHFKDNFQRLWN
jgi:hypothetical protein